VPSLEALNAVDLPLVALSTQGREISGYRFPARFGLVVGLEGLGLPEERGRWEAVSIPMEAGVESLNAAVAAGIAFYLWKEQLKSGVDEHP
jgi:tRNA G18 (ribose-2'-O)-methylase SpoU